MKIKFSPLASGSSGNATFIRINNTSILVDAGMSGKKIEANMKMVDESSKDLSAIFLTHGHSDHVQGAGVMSRRYDIPIFASPGTWDVVERKKMIGKIKPINKRYIHPRHQETYEDMVINAFPISHDCQEPIGFTFSGEYVKTAVATDMGGVTQEVFNCLKDCQVMLVESNHDEEMLENGPYPYYLKKRVGGHKGHLSNIACGNLIKKLQNENSDHILSVYLGHLSEDNNTPLVAYDTVSFISGLKDRLHVASRHISSEKTEIIYDVDKKNWFLVRDVSNDNLNEIKRIYDNHNQLSLFS